MSTEHLTPNEHFTIDALESVTPVHSEDESVNSSCSFSEPLIGSPMEVSSLISSSESSDSLNEKTLFEDDASETSESSTELAPSWFEDASPMPTPEQVARNMAQLLKFEYTPDFILERQRQQAEGRKMMKAEQRKHYKPGKHKKLVSNSTSTPSPAASALPSGPSGVAQEKSPSGKKFHKPFYRKKKPSSKPAS